MTKDFNITDDNMKSQEDILDNIMSSKPKRKEIVNRWRTLGLLDGITPNSATERRVADSFERMARFLYEDTAYGLGPMFTVVIFPIIRIMITSRGRCGHLTRVVEPEEILNAMKETTVNGMLELLKGLVSKRNYDISVMMCRMIAYKGVDMDADILSLLDGGIPVLEKSETELVSAMFGLAKPLDLEAEIVVMVSTVLTSLLK